MKRMRRLWMAFILPLISLGGLGLSLNLGAPAALAQGGLLKAQPLGVDITRFPTVTVFFQLVDLSRGLPTAQRVEVRSVREDGQEIPSGEWKLDLEDRGADIVILLDASQSILSPQSRGYTGEPRLSEAREFVSKVAQGKSASSRMVLIAPVGDRIDFIGPRQLTNNGGDVSNALQQFSFPPRPKGKEATPLFDLLSRAVEILTQRPDATGRPGVVIVLSDGIDFLSDQQVVDVTGRAMDNRIVVHAVQIGPAQGKGSERAMENMRRIAGQTGGQVLIFGQSDPEPFYQSLKAWAQVQTLHYRSRVRQSGTHQIDLQMVSGGQPLGVSASYAIHLSPPQVELDWEGHSEGRGGESSPILVSETPSLPLTIRIRWADSYGHGNVAIRQIRIGESVAGFEKTGGQVEGGAVIVQGIVDLSQAPQGIYPIRVDVEDGLGLSGTGEGPLIRQRIVPPSPAGRGLLDVLPLASCVVALVALMVAAIAITRVPRLREAAVSMTQPVVQRIKEVTEPFFPSGAARGSEPARAWLVVVEGEAERRTIPIRSTHVRLGRDETLANITFTDRSVSRLHCRIEEVEEGVFYIYDEGSTSGTYVNYEQVPINGTRLQDGDLINLGRVQLHFQLRLNQQEIRPPGPASKPEEKKTQDEGKTQPLREVDDRTQVFHEPGAG